jgi:membrane protein
MAPFAKYCARIKSGGDVKIPDLRALEQHFVWDCDYRERPAWMRLPVEVLRTLLHIVREFSSGELTLRAMSLVYTSILSLVPLLAFCFSVLKGFGVQNQAEPLLLEYLRPLGDEKAAEITLQIVSFVNNIDVRVLGAVGLGLLVYTIVTLMQKIEGALNHTWRIARSRSLGERFATFVSVLTVGPLLIFAALAITGSLMSHGLMLASAEQEPFGLILRQLAHAVPYVLVISAFTFIYFLVPNTRVRFLPALVGGIVAGFLWETAGYVFASFVASATSYQAVYATFGTAMLFMIWLYVSWLILLVGASTAFYVQQPQAVIARARRWRFSYETFEEVALAVLARITRRHYLHESPYSVADLSDDFQIPQDMIEEILSAFEAGAFLKQTADQPRCFVIAVPPEETRVAALVEALRAYQPARSRMLPSPRDAAAGAVRLAIASAINTALGEQTLKSLAQGDDSLNSAGS